MTPGESTRRQGLFLRGREIYFYYLRRKKLRPAVPSSRRLDPLPTLPLEGGGLRLLRRPLAGRAEDGRPLGQPYRAQRPAAAHTRLPGPAVDAVPSGKTAGASAPVHVVADGGAPGPGRYAKGSADRGRERIECRPAQTPGRPQRVDTSGKKDLVGVNIADTGQYALVKKGSLDRPRRLAEAVRERPGVERKRVGAEPRPAQGTEVLDRREDPESAEATRVAKDESTSLAFCMRVGPRGRGDSPDAVDVVAAAETLASRAEPELAGHAQVDAQDGATLGDDGELLPVPLEPPDRLPPKKLVWSRSARAVTHDIGSVQAHRPHLGPEEPRLEGALEMVDFW